MTQDALLTSYNKGEILLATLANDTRQCNCGTDLLSKGYRLMGNTLEFSFACPYCESEHAFAIDMHMARARNIKTSGEEES